MLCVRSGPKRCAIPHRGTSMSRCSVQAGCCATQRAPPGRSGACVQRPRPAGRFKAPQQCPECRATPQGEPGFAAAQLAAAAAATALPRLCCPGHSRWLHCNHAWHADVQQGPAHEQLDVAVVGGGPGGLAAAQALLVAR